ncbi:MAG: response regulator [Caulobacteraceae bacterium]|nr:response regulator [Caulobacter sp.]
MAISADIPRLERRAHILVVDDEPANRVVARKFCELFGASVTLACDGFEAVQACAGHVFDLVLMDMRMPGMNGFQACQEIRALPEPACAHVPIVIVTADAGTVHADFDRCIGLSGVVEKPLSMQRLFFAVSRALAEGSAATGREGADEAAAG